MKRNNLLYEADITRRMLDTLQNKTLNEESGGGGDVHIPINDNTFPNILNAEKEKMTQKINEIQFEDNPLIYNPTNNTISFTGVIKNMNNLRWYYTTDTSTPDSGCYIFVEGLQLNDKTSQILHLLYALYGAWSKEWSQASIEEKLKISEEQLETYKQKYSNINYFEL